MRTLADTGAPRDSVMKGGVIINIVGMKMKETELDT